MNQELLKQIASDAGDVVVDSLAEDLEYYWDKIGIKQSERLRFISEQIPVPEEMEPPFRTLEVFQVDRRLGIRADYREGEFVYTSLSVEEDGTVVSKGTYDDGVIIHELGSIEYPQILTEADLVHYSLRRLLSSKQGLGKLHDQLAAEGIPFSRITVETYQGTMSRVELAEYKGETLFTHTPSV